MGLRSQVWSFIPGPLKTTTFDAMRDHDKDFVLYSRIQRGKNKGFYWYAYGGDPEASAGKMKPYDKKGPLEGSGYDRSNSQYGVLGAWALEQSGAEIPATYWAEEDAAWKAAQLTDGGWNYNHGGENSSASLTMTAAGVATLFVTQDYMLRLNPHQFDTCKGGVSNINIERGLAWMDKHVKSAFTKGGPWFYYGLYGIERIGVASGRKYFGTVDWYAEGADAIVRSQGHDGSFGGTIHDTCFGLIFLVRGGKPVMMNKLIYETSTQRKEVKDDKGNLLGYTEAWNERPRDAANIAHWQGKHSQEGYLNWQAVNLKVSADELHDSPILYISGSEELALSDQDIVKLKAFVEGGGMILGNADCGSRGFAKSFKALGSRMFKYEFRPLPANHLIYSEQYAAKKWKSHPIVEGMSNGVRELMMLIPEFDPAHAWQNDASKTQEAAFQLTGNIFLYATGRENLEHKGATYIVTPDGPAGREIPLARIEMGDNWNPEPGAGAGCRR